MITAMDEDRDDNENEEVTKEDLNKREIVLRMLQLMAIDVDTTNAAAACTVFMANVIYNGFTTQNARMIAVDQLAKNMKSMLETIEKANEKDRREMN